MTTITCALWSAAWSMTLLVFMPWAYADAGSAPGGNPDMIRELQASGPNPSMAGGASALGRLVGTWSVEYGFISKDGKVTHKPGSYSAGWIMDGRAIQDIWTVDPSGDRKEREIYTTLHYIDPKSGTWYATFIDPEHVSVARFTGGVVGDDRIVILTHDFGVGRDNRWSFNSSGADSIVFRDEQSNDGGKIWRVVEEDHFTRCAADRTSM